MQVMRWNRICNIFRIHIDSCDVMPVELVPKALLHPGSEIWNGGQNRTGFPKVTSLFRPQLARFLVPNCSSAIYLASHKTQSCTDLALSMRQPKNQATNCDTVTNQLQEFCSFGASSKAAVLPSPNRRQSTFQAPALAWLNDCWDTVRLLTRDTYIYIYIRHTYVYIQLQSITYIHIYSRIGWIRGF